MAHIEFACKRQVFLGKGSIREFLGRKVAIFFLHCAEDFGDGVFAFGPFAEHIFVAGLGTKLHASHAGAFLSAVVLFLHHQIELVQPIHPGAVFLLIIIERFEQSDHCHAAFMFQGLHALYRVKKLTYSTVTDLARFRGWSTFLPLHTAMW